MRALTLTLLLLVACDELPEGTTDPAPTPSAVPSAQPTEDARIVPAAKAFLEAAETYVGRCYVQSDLYDIGVIDVCYGRGQCGPAIKANIDKNCGFTPDQPQAVVTAANALAKEAKDAHLSHDARVFARHAELFGGFVATSHKPNTWCLENADPYDLPTCWASTRGTLAKFQAVAKAWNRWHPNETRHVTPVENVIFSGAAQRPLYTLLMAWGNYGKDRKEAAKKRLREEGLPWKDCPDGPCLVDLPSDW